ncbi:hypothetical protein ACTI_60850 [Actinoplanes sp. OR16]|uniref:hypothetical protein n=1 Tax=Actinoplanes sp. OR16 TaxID=946334 RepID=UPI000F6B84A3|nr:hypothetical protein [Actinoplanes sp. OR16]BBH69400.1 hypothetical protein ACTI_60850 [Actinoplanes sp. OR16]
MSRYVIDAPTLLHLVDHKVAVDPGHRLVAPASIRSEALQLLLDDVRNGARDDDAAMRAHELLTGLKIRALNDRVSRAVAWRIAREQGWATLRDAEYAAVTRLQADALVTVDAALAGRIAGLVPVLPVERLRA